MGFTIRMLLLAVAVATLASRASAEVIEVGPRPYFLIDRMEVSDLKQRLLSCADRRFERKLFSIGHRGAIAPHHAGHRGPWDRGVADIRKRRRRPAATCRRASDRQGQSARKPPVNHKC